MSEDYYKTLGLNKTASLVEIKKSYRALVRKCHLDLESDDNRALFQEANEAYGVLSNEQKRADYDLKLEKPNTPPHKPYNPFEKMVRSWHFDAGFNETKNFHYDVRHWLCDENITCFKVTHTCVGEMNRGVCVVVNPYYPQVVRCGVAFDESGRIIASGISRHMCSEYVKVGGDAHHGHMADN